MTFEQSPGVFPLRGEFVGRAEALDQLVEAFEHGARCVTVTGSAGVGKTRLVEEFAHRFGLRFEAGVHLADTSEVDDRRGLLHALAEAFPELSMGQVSRPQLVACLAARCSGKRLLLLVDNFDRLLGAAGEIAAICRAVPSLRVLLTSREALQIEGESVLELLPLSVPSATASVAEVAASPAVRLLLTRVWAAGGAWAVETEQLSALVRRLEGLPLALELVAAWSLTLTPAQLLVRLSSNQRLVLTAKRTRGRHSSLAEALQSSWELLDEQEQLALAECSIFSGSFSLEACEQVLSLGNEALQTISALRSKSLLRSVELGRYQLYVAVRAFAGERLQELERERVTQLRTRHAYCFSQRAAAFNQAHALDASPAVATYDLSLELDADNLLAALAYLGPESGLSEAVKQAELAVACTSLHAAAQLQCLAFIDSALAQLELASPALVTGSLLLRVHLARTVVLARLGRYHESREANEALVGRLVGAERAAVLVRLGVMHRFEGDLASAESAHRAASRLLGSEDTRLALLNRACLARLLCDRGEVEAAREHNEAVRIDGLRLSDPWIVGMVVSNLAQLEQEQERILGHQETAAPSFSRIAQKYAQALAAFPASQVDNVLSSRMMLGDAAIELGQLAEAEAAYRHAEQFATRASGLSRGLLLGSFAVLLAERGEFAQARSRIDQGLTLVGRGPLTATFALRLYRAVVELFELRAQGSADARSAAALRLKALLKTEDARTCATMDLRTARRIAERALGLATADLSPRQVSISVARRELYWGSERIGLSRRPTLFRVLLALAEHHCESPGVPLDRFELVARAWPNERILPDAAATRLRVAVAHLRKLGLRELLRTHEEGYLLDPATVLRIEPTRVDEAA